MGLGRARLSACGQKGSVVIGSQSMGLRGQETGFQTVFLLDFPEVFEWSLGAPVTPVLQGHWQLQWHICAFPSE